MESVTEDYRMSPIPYTSSVSASFNDKPKADTAFKGQLSLGVIHGSFFFSFSFGKRLILCMAKWVNSAQVLN